MCGIAGLWALGSSLPTDDLVPIASKMADRLAHRGPDDADVWSDRDAGVALSHRRLAVIDLSPHGRQPMISSDGRYVIVFNGEIYNYKHLRDELREKGITFRGESDTEVLLACIAEFGLQRAIASLNGMFAFTLWDRTDRVLYLARDRLGEKPLYYGIIGGALAFASELKALRAFPQFESQIDRDVLALYVRHNYIPGPYSIYRGIRKVSPGTYLAFDERAVARGTIEDVRAVTYWSVRDAAEAGMRSPFKGSEADAEERLDLLLRDAVRLRMVADVPLGAFLSGGIDSSAVVATMQAQSSEPVNTFTIGFEERAYDEGDKARAVASFLHTEHVDLRLTASEARSVIPRLPDMYDEPFADSSQIPTFLVSQLARKRVVVSLSGDGGDELFGGYNRYFWGRTLWNGMQAVPTRFREMAASAIRFVPCREWDRLFELANPLLNTSLRQPNPGHKLHKIAGVIGAQSPEELYLRLISYWQGQKVVLDGSAPPTALTENSSRRSDEFFQHMMLLDTLTYLPDDILVKLDRASMAVSLESRVPLLDHRLVEFAWSLPASMKVRGNEGKWLLRRVLRRYLPQGLVDRPKMGFGVPIGAWLLSDLRDWAEDLLDERRLREDGLLYPEPIREKWRQHQSGARNWQDDLWGILMFQAWYRRNFQTG